MKRSTLLLAAVAAAAIVGVTAAATSYAGSSDGRTIRLVERGGSSTVVDNPPTGNPQSRLLSAGDFWAGTMKLYATSGERAGSVHVVCVATVSGPETQTRFQCQGTVRLADGTLALAALVERHPDRDVDHIAVVGGTGAYEGARGTMTSTPRSSGNVTDDEIHLLP
jgi:Allene oxide cyclase barrel like domain